MARDIHDILPGLYRHNRAARSRRRRCVEGATERIARALRPRRRPGPREPGRSAPLRVRALRPRILEENDLCEALPSLIRKMTATTGLKASFRCHGEALQLANGWDESFLRIGQESLTNTIHHADATQFRADLFFDNDEVRLELQDNGRGFDVNAQHAGFGLLDRGAC